MGALRDVRRIRADRSRTEDERLWKAIELLAKRFDDKSDDDDVDEVLGLLLDE